MFVIIFLFVFLSASPSNSGFISNDEFITGDDGVIRMYVNVIGHVQNPGTYLVYDNIDLLSMLSVAGGYLQGSNLNEIILYRSDGTIENINLTNYLNNKGTSSQLYLKPRDTIFVEQKKISELLTSTNLPSILLGMLNIILTISRDN